MWKRLHHTKRCELFNELSEVIWDDLSDSHQLGCNNHEDGITKYILKEFKRFSSNIIRNFQLYARPGQDEHIYGSDIDIYVGIGRGRYRWFALQAKLLKYNGIYNTMKDGYTSTNPTYQWDKLTLLEGVSGCKSYYLFYNGSAKGFKHAANDRCDQPFNERHFGCSLVETPQIKMDMENRLRSSSFKYPRFSDYHPSMAVPWRTLVCCPHRKWEGDYTPYFREDIEGSVEEYERIEAPLESDSNEYRRLEEREERFIESELELSKIERPPDLISISDASGKVKWNPQYKIVINTTQDSDKYGK